jgi:hypothetical protein
MACHVSVFNVQYAIVFALSVAKGAFGLITLLLN